MAARKKRGQATELAAQTDPRAPLDGALLLAKAQEVLRELEADLLARARGSEAVRRALEARHAAEKAQRRTADPLEIWERGFVTQVAASWFLSCVFVRTLEDRGLLSHARFAGPGALDSQRLFFEMAPSLTEREYMLTVFRELTRLPAAKELFDAKHNPVWMLGPSAGMAKKLLALFRTPTADAPGFRFGQDDTRFLGDLYQDLSEEVRERFALLQTPRFVEKYILERTLDRAIQRFGLDETTIIDPTCGSGHFLLGAFERLLDERLRREPGLDIRKAAERALDAVYGADINPYAVAIARFRLTLAFLEKGGFRKLAEAPELPLHLVVADSLLHNPGVTQTRLMDLPGQSAKDWAGEEFALEDEEAAKAVLHRTFAAVVGNPPYITVKDAALREEYRKMYSTAYKTYSMGVPFTERFFQLARKGGFVGMITANSFMKREFGKKLIEDFLPDVNLDGIVNTSGAYIPGHGTPTVLLFGTAEAPQGDSVLVVLAKRGEPRTPDKPEQGLVWSSIAQHGGDVGFDNEYISVARVARVVLKKHPWSLGGGGAAELKELLEQRAASVLGDIVDLPIGRAARVGMDDVYMLPRHVARRIGAEACWRDLLIGEAVRDWGIGALDKMLFPYEQERDLLPRRSDDPALQPVLKYLWPFRKVLAERATFQGVMSDAGLEWYEYMQYTSSANRTPLSIAFAFVATHNHFVLDRGGKVFKQSAPIIKLKDTATEEDHLALLAYLNSSTACFWMKQVMMDKGATSDRGVLQADPEKFRFEFDGTKLSKIPLPPAMKAFRGGLLVEYGRRLSQAGTELANFSFDRAILAEEPGSIKAALHSSLATRASLRRRMVAWQEELDWLVYEMFGLLPPDDTASAASDPEAVAEIDPEDRAYRQSTDSGSVRVLAARAHPSIGLIERPEYKRRWFRAAGAFDADNVTDDMLVEAAAWRVIHGELEQVLASSLEPVRLIDLLAKLHDRSAAASAAVVLDRDLDRALVAQSLTEECIPYLAAYRLTDSGLEKRMVWERVWDLQRAEDRGEEVPPFQPPPKYDSKDYRDPTYWRLRGKLDVPKERFISYPGCESDEDKEPVFGWAGWNHLQQAQALAALYQARKTNEAWGKDRLTPMLAGLLELLPWVKQWHNEPNPEFGGLRLGDYFEGFLDGECHALGITRQDLRDWRPPEKTRAKKAKTKKPAPSETSEVEP